MTEFKNIFVIEENHSDRLTLREMLENYGCHVSTFHSNSDVEAALDEHDCSLIIVNYEAPGLPCADLILSVKTKYPDIDILVTSCSESVQAAVNVMKHGALDYIIKPVSSEKIFSYADKVFTGKKGGIQPGKKQSVSGVDTAVIITENSDIKKLLTLIEQVADSTASIFIQGESGTGKELFARYVHEKSNRQSGPFIAVNCAALPENLLESELFGHEKGAFTGAIARKAGKFELATNGTILLDEITEMPMHLQAKLLRVLQEREVDLVGGTSPVKIDVRVIATTNRNIEKAMADVEFREDLYYRLNVIPVLIPPLRDRWDDIVPLADFFIKKFNRVDGRAVKCLTKDAIDTLSGLPFKGNVRELENIIQRAVLLSDGETIQSRNLFMNTPERSSTEGFTPRERLSEDILASPLKEVERKMIMHTLEKTGGNRTHAAKILEISVRTLRNKLNEYKEKEIAL